MNTKLKIRIGLGYDIHRLSHGDFLVIGGVKIPFHKKFVAHSDGDVLVHSIIDGILGALGEGDIGTLFPDTSPEYKNINSFELLKRVLQMVDEKGYYVETIDSVVIAQEPKLSPYIMQMRKNLSKILNIPLEWVSIKAKTKERLGEEGKGNAISSFSIVLLRLKS